MKKRFLFGGFSAVLIAAAAYAAPGAESGMMRAKLDVNGDGNITKAEVIAHADARFAKMDADSNGVIDASDRLTRTKSRFAKMDTDQNGSINEAEFISASNAKAEARKAGRGAKRGGGSAMGGNNVGKWGRGDANNDNAISRSEYDAATMARFSARDKDGNGTLTAEEMKVSRKFMRGRRGQGMQSPDDNAG